MYVCMYVCMYVYMYIYIYIHIISFVSSPGADELRHRLPAWLETGLAQNTLNK